MRRFILALTSVAALAMAGSASAEDYKVLAPAAPGGGWDQTARTMQSALQDEKISGSVQVINVPGAGGTIGLAQFVNQNKGDPSQLIVGGYVMVGAILTNKSPVTLEQITPIARLTGEYEAIVVPASSDIQNIGDLAAKLKADPGSVSWGGGSAGGTDHITAGLFAKAAGVDPTKVNYIAFSGGGEALAAILGNQVTVGISGYGEFESQIKYAAHHRHFERRARGRHRRTDLQGRRRGRFDPELAHGRRGSRHHCRAGSCHQCRYREDGEVGILAEGAEGQGLGGYLPCRSGIQGAACQGRCRD